MKNLVHLSSCLIVLMVSLLPAHTAQSSVFFDGTLVGNGGYAVEINGKYYPLDLVLRGLHYYGVKYDENLRLSAERQTKLALHLERVLPSSNTENADVLRLTEFMLAQLDGRVRELEISLDVNELVDNMARYSWANLYDAECQDVGDDNMPIKDKVQVAFRRGSWVRFCKHFNDMMLIGKTAIILHEILYAKYERGQPHISELVGLMFDPDYQTNRENYHAELRTIVDRLAASQTPGSFDTPNP